MSSNWGVIQFFRKYPKFYSGFRDLADVRKNSARADSVGGPISALFRPHENVPAPGFDGYSAICLAEAG